MTRVILFDLGDTLEINDVLRPGAIETLTALRGLRDADGDPVALGLVSDFVMPQHPSEIPSIRRQYLDILDALGIRSFFEPVDERVTLSTEVGVGKPDARVFRAAIDKIHPGAHYHTAIFITENAHHVDAARQLGLSAILVRAPGQPVGEVEHLSDLVPLIRRLLEFDPCGKRAAKAKGRFRSQTSKAKAADPAITQIVERVDEARLLATVKGLGDFGTRWSHSAHIGKVTDWIHAQFVAAGYGGAGECRFQQFTLPGAGLQRNVLASKGASDRGIILLCSHYDSVSERPKDVAPGADDDGSGVAATLEIARLLAGIDVKRQVLFAAFGGEEQGLFGSGECADIAARERWPIHVVINMDMIGASAATPMSVVVEYDQGNRNPANDTAAKAFAMVMAQAGADYTSLDIEHTDIWNSDYMPFEAKGFACIGAYEGGDNPFYHKSTDTVDRLDGAYLKAVTQMVLATTLVLAR